MSMRGFTLIETMVAVSILTLAVAGPLFTANRALVAAAIARDQLTASYLAQEGVEYLRAMRDNEFLIAYYADGSTASSVGWNSFITSVERYCLNASCTLDSALPSVPMGYGSGYSLAPVSGDARLYLTNCTSGSGGLSCTAPNVYTARQDLSGSARTAFTRTIRVVHISADEEQIVSTVSWSYHGTTFTMRVTDHLTSWQ